MENNKELLEDLSDNIANYILPRLEFFRKEGKTFPAKFNNSQEWLEILDKIILGFETYKNRYYDEDIVLGTDKKLKHKWDIIQEGLDLFAKYFKYLHE